MKSFFCMYARILRSSLLCITLLYSSISFAGVLEELTVKANQGHADAQYNLGIAYRDGKGVSKDDEQAFVWFTKAANQGDSDAQYKLGVLYYLGEGAPQDDKQAFVWFTKAANYGHANAQYGLGDMYSAGRAVPQDYKQAYVWHSLAAANGYSNASKDRDDAKAKLTPKQLTEAQEEAKVLFDKIEANKPK